MAVFRRLLARWCAIDEDETVLEVPTYDSEFIEAEYHHVLAAELRRWSVPDRCVAIDVRQVRPVGRRATFIAVVRLLHWDRTGTLRLMLGLPFLDRRVRTVLRSHWLTDVSEFAGVCLQASDQLLDAPEVGELREVLQDLTGTGADEGLAGAARRPRT